MIQIDAYVHVKHISYVNSYELYIRAEIYILFLYQ